MRLNYMWLNCNVYSSLYCTCNVCVHVLYMCICLNPCLLVLRMLLVNCWRRSTNTVTQWGLRPWPTLLHNTASLKVYCVTSLLTLTISLSQLSQFYSLHFSLLYLPFFNFFCMLDKIIQRIALTWMQVFLELAGRTLMRFTPNILVAVLPCMAYKADRESMWSSLNA